MKTIILLIVFTGLFLQVTAPPPGHLIIPMSYPINPYEKLWEATCFVESSFNPFAIGDMHLEDYSYGVAQIRQIRLDDYNKRTGQRLLLQDVYDIQISKTIWLYYASKFHYQDIVGISRSWNGMGSSSILYAEKIISTIGK